MDRVDFEELALHSVDTSLGPQVTNLGKPNVSIDEKDKRSVRPMSIFSKLKLKS